MTNSIEVRGLTKHYKDFSLQDVTFEVPQGSIMGFIGENGAGKTTTIKSILGLLHLDGGTVRVMGKDPVGRHQTIGEDVGVVMEGTFFSATICAAEICSAMADLHPRWDSALFWDYCKRFALPEKKPMKDYSRGMRVKMAFATALSHRPKLLILDEATSGLDPVVRSEILDLFLEFIQDEEHSVLLSSHITSDLEKVADYITFIHEGKIVFTLPKDEMMERYAMVKCGRGEEGKLNAAHVVGRRETKFDVELLVDNAPEVRRCHPSVMLEAATIDDIMTFFAKRSAYDQ